MNQHAIVALSASWSVAAWNRLAAGAGTVDDLRQFFTQAVDAMKLASSATQQMSALFSDPIIEAEVSRHWGQLAGRLLELDACDVLQMGNTLGLPPAERWRSIHLDDSRACREYVIKMGLNQCVSASDRYYSFGLFDDCVKCTISWASILLHSAVQDPHAVQDVIQKLETDLKQQHEWNLTHRTVGQAMMLLAQAYQTLADLRNTAPHAYALKRQALHYAAEATSRTQGRALGDYTVAQEQLRQFEANLGTSLPDEGTQHSICPS